MITELINWLIFVEIWIFYVYTSICTHTSIFYHMKTIIPNFLISYFIMKLGGLENIKCFIF